MFYISFKKKKSDNFKDNKYTTLFALQVQGSNLTVHLKISVHIISLRPLQHGVSIENNKQIWN